MRLVDSEIVDKVVVDSEIVDKVVDVLNSSIMSLEFELEMENNVSMYKNCKWTENIAKEVIKEVIIDEVAYINNQ